MALAQANDPTKRAICSSVDDERGYGDLAEARPGRRELRLLAGILRAQRSVVHLVKERPCGSADAPLLGPGPVEPHPRLEPPDLVYVAGRVGHFDAFVQLCGGPL